MSLHDAYARLTPFEIAFPDEGVFDQIVERVSAEAAERGVEGSDPQVFLRMDSVADAVGRLRAPDDGPDASHRFAALIFQGVQYAMAGRPTYLVETPVARQLVRESPAATPAPPTTAGYLQLPQHLFWVGEPGSGTPESVDGGFWTVSRDGTLHTLLVTGIRPERPGFGVFSLPEAPLADAKSWLDATIRESGDDFATALEGAELDGLYSVEAAGEALKLLARFFAYTSSAAGVLAEREPAAAGEEGPRPSALPYTSVQLAA